MEFRDYHTSPLEELPAFNIEETRAIDHFWRAMANVTSITNSEVYCLVLYRVLNKYYC